MQDKIYVVVKHSTGVGYVARTAHWMPDKGDMAYGGHYWLPQPYTAAERIAEYKTLRRAEDKAAKLNQAAGI